MVPLDAGTIAFHIPPIVNAFATLRHGVMKVKFFWNRSYRRSFLKQLRHYSTIVTAVFSGHLHMDGFAVLNASSGKPVADTFVPSISPVYGNNPGFKFYSYDADHFDLTNYVTYFLMDNKQNRLMGSGWRLEYNFNRIYQSECKSCRLLDAMQKISFSGPLAQSYKKYYPLGHVKDHPILTKWKLYWCALGFSKKIDYKFCVK
jgi:hypothetical protein